MWSGFNISFLQYYLGFQNFAIGVVNVFPKYQSNFKIFNLGQKIVEGVNATSHVVITLI
jgi:hypothetical protein